MLLNIIGAGHLGKTMGYLLAHSGLISIAGVCNRSQNSAGQAIEFMGAGSYVATPEQLPAADVTLISTPDDRIADTCAAFSKNPALKQGSIIFHCSGSLTSDALIAAKAAGCYVASVHPMRSFARPELSIQQYNGTWCALEGDEEAIAVLQPLFESMGSITYTVHKEKKSLYHAAGVFASNYLVTLAQQALLCLTEAGVEQDMAMSLINNLMHGTLSNLEQSRLPAQALTGPIQRGDVVTLRQHMQSFTHTETAALYVYLGMATLPMTALDAEQKAAVIQALSVE